MAEPKPEGAVPEPEKQTPKQPEPVKKEEINTESLTEKIKADLELKYKEEISGRDKKLTQIQKELNARLTEEERIKQEAEKEHKAMLEDYAKMAVRLAGLDEVAASLINGAKKEDIDEKIKDFSKVKETLEKPFLDEIKAKDEKIKSLEEEINILKASGAPPKSGTQTEPATLQSSYDEAKKKNDFALQTAIKRQAAKEGVTLRE